jgi:hypothetical protein
MSFTQVQRSSRSRTMIPIGARVRSDDGLKPFTADEETAAISVTETSQMGAAVLPRQRGDPQVHVEPAAVAVAQRGKA